MVPAESTAPAAAPGPAEGGLLWLQVATFDPLAGIPLDESLLADGDTDHLIVQFDGPVLPEWRASLSDVGCDIIWYIPDHAFLVFAPSVDVDALSSLPHIRYAGPYHPGYKLSPGLFADGADVRTVNIEPLRDPDVVVAAVEALGGVVTAAGLRIVTAAVPPARFVDLAHVPEVGWVEPAGGGSFYNDISARILMARQVADGNFTDDGMSMWSYNGTSFQGTTGKGVNVMVTDTGMDGTHPAFNGRKVHFSNLSGEAQWSDYHGHGTHCAGTILGNGSFRPPPAAQGASGTFSGVAPEASLLASVIGWDALDNLWKGLTVEKVINDTEEWGVDVSSNSWGCCGAASTYSVAAQLYDDAVRDSNKTKAGNQSIVYVFAAGNSGPGGTISNPGLAKNVITVGATGDDKYGWNRDMMAPFSSGGPTGDGRIKPDVSAPGVGIMSAYANTVSFSYTTMSGTSMATPAVAGAAALVISHFETNLSVTPSPAMVKAVLIGGTNPLANINEAYPNVNQGWGRVNVSGGLLERDGRTLWNEDQKHLLDTGKFVDYNFKVLTSSELRIHLVWTDVSAAPTASRALVNDLDLEVIAPNGTVYRGNNFSADESVADGGRDSVNNVEGFRLLSPALGNWTVRVNATDVPSGPQDYAITINGHTNLSMHFADVAVSDLGVSPLTPVEGDGIHITANISSLLTNVASVGYSIKVDDVEVLNGTLTSLLKGTPARVETVWAATRGSHNVTVLVDPLMAVAETDRTNNMAEGSFWVGHYGLDVEAVPLVTDILPGEVALWDLRIHNNGTVEDNYNISWEDPGGGWVVDTNRSAVVPSGAMANFTVTLMPPSTALAGSRLVSTITVSSLGNSSYKGTAAVSALVLQFHKMTMGLKNDTRTLLPGESALFEIEVGNLGNGPDAFDMSIEVISDSRTFWTMDLDTKRLEVDPGTDDIATLSVTADPKARGGYKATAIVRAVRSSDPATKAEVRVFVDAAPVRDVTSVLTPAEVTVMPGDGTSHELVVTNGGNVDEHALVSSITCPDGWSLVFDRDSLDIAPFSKAGDFANAEVPASALAGTWSCNYTLLVRSGAGGSGDDITLPGTVLFHVSEVHKARLSVAPSRLSGVAGDGFTIAVDVHNDGNAPDDIRLSFSGQHTNWSLRFGDGTDHRNVDAGATWSTKIVVNTTNDTAWNRPLRITGTYGDGEEIWADVPVVLVLPPPPADNPPPGPGPTPVDNGTDDDRSGEDLLLPGWSIMLLVLGLIILVAVAVALVLSQRRDSARSRVEEKVMKAEGKEKEEEVNEAVSADGGKKPEAGPGPKEEKDVEEGKDGEGPPPS